MPSRPSSHASRSPRTQEPESRGSSSHSEGGSRRNYEAAVNFFGPEDDAHRAVSVGWSGAARTTLHHARSDPERDQDRFFYEEVDRPVLNQGHTGMSRVARLSSRERGDAETRLRAYGNDDSNLPRISSGTNCHNFASGAVGALEAGGHARPGSHAFWEGQHHRPQSDVVADLEREGRHFQPTVCEPRTGPADFAFGQSTEERRPTGRLNMAAFANLESRRPSSPSRGRSSSRE